MRTNGGQEKITFDKSDADDQDFKFNFDTKPEVKRRAFDNLRK